MWKEISYRLLSRKKLKIVFEDNNFCNDPCSLDNKSYHYSAVSDKFRKFITPKVSSSLGLHTCPLTHGDISYYFGAGMPALLFFPTFSLWKNPLCSHELFRGLRLFDGINNPSLFHHFVRNNRFVRIHCEYIRDCAVRRNRWYDKLNNSIYNLSNTVRWCQSCSSCQNGDSNKVLHC